MTRDHAAYQNQPGFEPPPHQHNVHERFQQEYMGQPHPHLQGYLSANQNMGGQHEAIKRDIEQSIARHDLPRAFGELNVLKHHEYRQAFHQRYCPKSTTTCIAAAFCPTLVLSRVLKASGCRPDGYAGGMPPGEFPQQQAYGANPNSFLALLQDSFRKRAGKCRRLAELESYLSITIAVMKVDERRYAGANHQGWGFEPGQLRSRRISARADPET